MISIPSLWLPILLGGVLAFLTSSVIHMVLKYHRNDFRQLPDEEAVRSALGPLKISPGDYVIPYGGGPEAMKSEAFQAKMKAGPVAVFTVLPADVMTKMGSQLTQWFLYTLAVGVVVAYVAGRTLPAGADYLAVFRLTGTVAFACYAMGVPQRSIWYSQSWSTTLKTMCDGLVYALLTAGAFGWLWPAA
jgi:hypothetical protein